MTTTHTPAATLELSTIQPIAAHERHGRARDLFTIWFGSNIMLLTVVTGALAVTVFKLPFFAAVLALVLGNLIGGIFMALHSAQGPQLGVPQMVQTRGQFGSFGSLLVVALVVIMYLGFFASNLVLGGQSLNARFPAIGTDAGILLVGVVSVVATVFGYRLIHGYTRLMSWLSGAVLLASFVWLLFVHGLPADFLQRNQNNLPGFLGALSVAALWQLAYAPYVSDYSRYMPQDTGSRTAFWSSYWGCCLGSILPMLLGVMVGLCVSDGNVIAGLIEMTGGLSALMVAVFSIGIAATNAMNLYCGTLSTITVGQTLLPAWTARAGWRALIALLLFSASLAIALLGQDNFMANYTNFILLLLYVLVPWSAINLVDYYLVAHGQYDVPSFFRRDGGIYGTFNWTAVNCYVLGILVQVPFMSTELYTGVVARAMNGADISWIVGLGVVSPVYWLASRKRQRALQAARA
ncbi:purine-cytosine permease family protein [Pseudomonas panipatensis]|uniref:Nucleobase:cation symporter-1, NCS1 family n=1 Tax=Pseudomonas panipatensis TaxID=428992 RepID=A0A1G8M184_9PSED|nr:cytosine permease [Pseudomonas panipatensis]SDI61706.1 nucleobase:cation symporter-1, NCS1 family [Pseudomonas panipatensis]SMP48285.1 nucleobase:cation symporter-1, NCS1 family [Pseudomonas panipatensis]